jgi:predicted enzyme related to lactoylglutathione lyase
MTQNPVCYWELASSNAEKSERFFHEVFGWNFEYDEKTTIYELAAGEGQKAFAGGGIFTLTMARVPFLTIYIKVDDIEEKAKKIEECGGLITIPPRVVTPGGPKICLFNEPSGVTFAMIQAAKK